MEKTKAQTKAEAPREVRDYLVRQGVPPGRMPRFLDAIALVRRLAGDVRATAIDDAADYLSRELQAAGVLWGEVRVQDLLADALAIGHPVVQAAFEIFDDRLLAVTPRPGINAGQ